MKYLARITLLAVSVSTYSCAVSGLSAGMSDSGDYTFSVALRPTGKKVVPTGK